jgi:hypothetical protein
MSLFALTWFLNTVATAFAGAGTLYPKDKTVGSIVGRILCVSMCLITVVVIANL